MKKFEDMLIDEAVKMRTKLENELKGISFDTDNKDIKNEVVNINAYISDCKHFKEKGDAKRAFEAIVFAWGIYECLLSLQLVKK